MEQPNGMMPNGLPAGPNQTMQRPQNGNWQQQLHAKVMEHLRNNMGQFQNSWQAVVDPRERANKIIQLITMLRQINQNQNIANCIGVAQNFEHRTLQNAMNREQYNKEIGDKLRDITQRRQQQANQMGLMPGMMPGQNNQMQSNIANMHSNGLPFHSGGNMGMQPGQMNFGQSQQMFNPQLQRPMQPSPLNMQQQAQQQQQQANTLDPSALQLQPQQQNQTQSVPNNGLPNPGQPQNMGQNGQVRPVQVPQQEILLLAKRIFDSMAEEQRQGMRQRLLANMTEQQRSQVKGDPVMRLCAQRAQHQLQQQRQNGSVGAPQNRSGEQNMNLMNGNMPARPPSQTGGQMDFSNFLGQQQNARKLQESGEQVVPASNNVMGVGSQMNMPQSINPLMLANSNNSQGGTGGNGALGQGQNPFINMQREAQARERLQHQQMAQKHAAASRGHLQGQPGGLHAPTNFNNTAAGQANSPAMSMLNRPMVPPGQAGANTPQQNRQQPAPSTPMSNAAQLSQHHQNMVQNNQQQQQMIPGMSANPTVQELLAKVPQHFRERLANMPVEQVKQFLMKWHHTQGRRPGQPGFPGLPGQQGMPNPMAAQIPGNQQMQNPLQQQMGDAVSSFKPQPPRSDVELPEPVRMQIEMRAREFSRFPRQILNQLNILAPEEVLTWGQLKQHALRTSGQATQGRVAQMQMHYIKNTDNGRDQFAMIFNGLAGQWKAAQSNSAGPLGMQMNPAQPGASIPQAPQAQMAPQAQIIPPAPMMQPTHTAMPPGMNQGQPRMPPVPPPTPQEMAVFRSKVPQAQSLTDEQIRSLIIKNKIERLKAFQSQQKQQAGQMPGQPNQAGMLPHGGLANATQPPQRVPQPTVGQPAVQKPNAPKATPQTNNDVIEISSQPAQSQQGPMPTLAGSQPRPQMSSWSQEQLSKLPPQQREAFEKMRQQQAMAQMMTNQAMGTKIAKMSQEVIAANPKGPAIQIDEAGMERAREKLKKLWNPLRQLSTTYPAALTYGFDEQRIKDIMKAREIVTQNSLDETGQIKDYLSVTPDVLLSLERVVSSYMLELKSRKERFDAQKRQAQGSNQGQSAPSLQQPQASGMAPSTSQQSHGRKASTSAKAPPAPTDNKTFDWGPRPDGVPKYDSNRNELTPDKLKFPQKRRKTDQSNSQASTPAAQAGTPAAAGASPALGKMQSPEHQRKSQAQLKAEADREAEKKKFRCKDQACEASMRGFDSPEQLKEHEQAQHQPLENPLDYLVDTIGKIDDATKAGEAAQKAANITPPKVSLAAQTKPRTATVRDLQREELTKLEVEQIARGTTPASVKDKIIKKQAEFDAATKAAQNELTLGQSMAQKLDIEIPTDPIDASVVAGASDMLTFEDAILQPNNNGWDPVTVDDISQWLTDGWVPTDNDAGIWELRPGLVDSESSPELTPGSQSSDVNQSDAMKFTISMENMDADLFGDGSGGAPESLIPLYFQIKDMAPFQPTPTPTGEDATMGGTGEGQSPKKRKAEEMWSQPIGDVLDDFFDFSQ